MYTAANFTRRTRPIQFLVMILSKLRPLITKFVPRINLRTLLPKPFYHVDKMKTRYEEMRLEAAEIKEKFLMRVEDIRLGAIDFKENVEFFFKFMP